MAKKINVFQDKYKDHVVKHKMSSVDEIKKAWSYLRSYYRDIVKERRGKSGQAAGMISGKVKIYCTFCDNIFLGKVRNWDLFRSMEFLRPTVLGLEGVSSLEHSTPLTSDGTSGSRVNIFHFHLKVSIL